MSVEKRTTLSVSYDGCSWQAEDDTGHNVPLVQHEGETLPELPDGCSVHTLILPVEMLLSRTFSLPLSSPRFIDADILAQELDEQTGEDIGAWWLSWQAATDGDGVKGVVFALPNRFKQLIDEHVGWGQVNFVGVDLQLRLNTRLARLADRKEGLIVLFDADRDGLAFGLCGCSEKGKPIWHGMRRLNIQGTDEDAISQAAFDICQTLAAMGWHDGQALIATGLLSSSLHAALALPEWCGSVVDPAELPDRHQANLDTDYSTGLNFRHGRWRTRAKSAGGLKPWYRTMAFAAALVLIWSAGMIWQNSQLADQNEQMQAKIIDAFHRGLPNEPVIIDALAQLRRAAGSSGTIKNQTVKLLNQVAIVNRVYASNPWQMKELSFSEGKMQLSGIATDLASMNKIQQLLQKESSLNVSLKDSDLSGNQVKFRMSW